MIPNILSSVSLLPKIGGCSAPGMSDNSIREAPLSSGGNPRGLEKPILMHLPQPIRP